VVVVVVLVVILVVVLVETGGEGMKDHDTNTGFLVVKMLV